MPTARIARGEAVPQAAATAWPGADRAGAAPGGVRHGFSLRTRLAGSLVAFAVLLAGVMAWTADSTARNAVQERAGMQLRDRARSGAEAWGAMLETVRERLAAWAGTFGSPEADAHSPVSRIDRLLATAAGSDLIEPVLVVDAAGTVLASTDVDLEGRSIADRPWWTAGTASGKRAGTRDGTGGATTRIGALVAEPLLATRAVPIVARLDRPGDPVAALVGFVTHEHLAAELTARWQADHADAPADGASQMLVDAHGALLWAGDRATTAVLAGPLAAAIGHELQARDGWRRASIDGRELLIGHAPPQQLPVGASAVTAVAWQDASAVLAPVTAIRGDLAAAAAGFVLLGSIVALIVSRRISTALHELTEETSRIAAGAFGSEIPVRGNDEIGQLASAFNAMSKALQASVTELEDSVRRANEAANAKSQFLAVMSHEIRTPLNGVMGMTELLANTPLSERQAHYAWAINESGRNLLDIINSILHFSKIEAGKVELAPSEFALRDFLLDVCALHAPQAERRGIALIHDLPDSLDGLVTCDRMRLRQVLHNLLGNACKFTECGTVQLRVEAVDVRPAHVLLRFQVIDTGIGIAREMLARIFEPFTQADASSTRAFGGTGLGLAIAHDLVALMGGTLEVESTPGAGTTFQFMLDLPWRSADAAGHPGARERLAGWRVICVDDSPLNREIISGFLADWGIACTTTGSAQACLDELVLARQHDRPYHAALVDYRMPQVDGLELAALIRAEESLAGLHLVLLSSQTAVDLSRHAGSLAVDRCLTKPIRRDDLHDALVALARSGLPTDPPRTLPAGRTQRPQFAARVLLAEDSELNSEMAVTMLEWFGIHTVTVTNGAEAVAAFERHAFDLVLMDCRMEGMDGYQATRIIRAFEARTDRPRTPVIAVTANAVSGDRERCLAAGMDDHLGKPFDSTELLALLDRWIGGLRGPDSALDRGNAAPPTTGVPVATGVTGVTGLPAGGELIDPAPLEAFATLQRPDRPSVVDRVLDTFGREAPLHVHTLLDALRAAEPVRAARAAHTLKSASANVGARRLAEVCKQVEGRVGECDADALEAELVELVEQSVHALGAWRATRRET